MTWDVAIGIFALVAFVIAVGRIIENNTRAMTELKCGIEDLKAALPKIQGELDDHEHRLTVVEKK